MATIITRAGKGSPLTSTEVDANFVNLNADVDGLQTALDGKQPTGAYLTGNQTITLSGDVSGSGTTSIAVTVADDSHNHIIANVDGLQTALDGKLATGAKAADSELLDGIDSTSFLRSDANDIKTGYLRMNDGSTNYIALGSGLDFRMWHDGTNTYFRNYNEPNGDMIWQTEGTGGVVHNAMIIRGNSPTPNVELYYDDVKKLETTSAGATVTGNLTASGDGYFAGNVSVGTSTALGRFVSERPTGAGWALAGKTVGIANEGGLYFNATNDGELVARNASGTVNVSLKSNGDSFLNGGNVGVNTDGPLSELDVNGTVYSQAGTTFDPPGVGTDTSTTAAYAFNSGSAIVGVNNGYIRNMFSWTSNSDITIGQGGTSLIGGINLIPGSAGNVKVNGQRVFAEDYHPNADKWTTARTITLGGVLSGSTSIDGSGNVTLTAAHTSDPTLTLAGDATGSATFTNLGNATLTVTVADDSHNHIIANVDGLQTALDGKLATGAKAADSNLLDGIDSASFLRSDATDSASGALTFTSTANHYHGHHYFDPWDVDGNHYPHYMQGGNSNGAQVNWRVQNSSGDFDVFLVSAGNNNITWRGNTMWNAANDGSGSGLDADLLDGQHGSYYYSPANAPDPTLTLSGDATGSATFTNLGNATLSVTVVDDSHNHIIANVDGLQTALDAKASITYVDTAVANIVDTAPAALNTLNELAAALGDDPNFATTVSTNIGTKANSSVTISAGGGLTGGGNLTANRTISHADTSTQASVNNSGAAVIQDVTLDTYGHVTGLASKTLTAADVGAITGNQTITLSGDVSGSGTTSIVVTVADDSHNHIIANVDGLQTALDGKLASTATTFSGDATNKADITTRTESGFYEHDTATTAEGWPIDSGWMHLLATTHTNDANYYSMQFAGSFFNNDDIYYRATNASGTTGWAKLWNSSNDGSGSGLDADLLDGQHGSYYYSPANAPDPTLTLSGDATGSATFTNLGNATLTVTVVDDSHNHIIANVDGLQTALDGKLATGAKAADSNLLDGIDSASFLRSDVSDTVAAGRQISFYSNADIESASGDQASLEVIQGTAGADAFMQFHVASDFAAYFGLDGSTNDFAVGGWSMGANKYKVWHQGNDGSGSGLDADLLDGQHGSYYYSPANAPDPTLTLSGDATGSATFTNLGNATLSVTVVDDSHNHIIANVDGLQTALDGKQPTGAYLTGNQTITLSGDLSGSGTTSINAQIAANVVGANELNVTGNGTTAQYLRSDGDGTFTWATPTNTTYSAGGGLSLAGTVFSHTDTSAQASVNNSGATVIQDVTLDTYGHVTALGSVTLTAASVGALASGGKAADSNLLDGVDSTAFVRNNNGAQSIAGNLTVGSGTSSHIYMVDSDHGNRSIHNNSNQIGFLTQAGGWGAYCDDSGNWTSVGNVTAYSDERLKSNIQTIENAVDTVKALRGVTFEKDGKASLGVIAQEVQKVLPELVHEGDEYLSVAYGNMVGVLIEAIKEQQAQIDKLKSKLGM